MKESLENLNKAWNAFIVALAEALGINRLVDSINNIFNPHEIIHVMPEMATKTLKGKYFSRVKDGKVDKEVLTVSANGWPIYYNEQINAWRVHTLAFIWNGSEFDCIIRDNFTPSEQMKNATIDESLN